jgi:hypothetical protein
MVAGLVDSGKRNVTRTTLRVSDVLLSRYPAMVMGQGLTGWTEEIYRGDKRVTRHA